MPRVSLRQSVHAGFGCNSVQRKATAPPAGASGLMTGFMAVIRTVAWSRLPRITPPDMLAIFRLQYRVPVFNNYLQQLVRSCPPRWLMLNLINTCAPTKTGDFDDSFHCSGT